MKAARVRAEEPMPAGKATVFLGAGRITGALLAGLSLARYERPIIVHDRHPNKMRQLSRQYGVHAEANLLRAVGQARILIIAVRPDSVRGLLEEIGEEIGKVRPTAVVSLAAGIPMANLRAWAKFPAKWTRAQPSPVARSGRGLTALTFDRGFPVASRRSVRDFFAKVGMVLEIPESKLDAFTVVYSPSHGYHALATLAEVCLLYTSDAADE